MRPRAAKNWMGLAIVWAGGWSIALSAPGAYGATASPESPAHAILEATGVAGGLIVHLGCGDGKLTAELGANDGCLVHGLDRDAQNVRRARESIRSRAGHGNVSVDRLAGSRLPYVDNLVKLVVAEQIGEVPLDEIFRVLAPGGVAYVKRGAGWEKTVKPRPAEIDEWTHFLHDATNNAVAQDSVVGPPRQLQWLGGPTYARSHDHLASVSAAVSSAGRIFYVVDEAPIAAVVLEPDWQLVARDAFSGVVLWKRPIARWEWHLRGFRSGPSDLARRLVAVDDRVYVTLSIDGPLSALDAATGETLRTYDGTDGTLEVVHDAGTLYVVAGDAETREAADKAKRRGERPGFAEVRAQRPAYPEPPPLKRVVALEARSGRVLWTKSDADTAEVMPTTLAVSDRRAFFQNADHVVCLDALSGEPVWRAERPVSRSRPTWSAPTLVVYGDVVLSGDRAVAERSGEAGDNGRKVEWIVSSAGGQSPVGEIVAFSAADGRRLWTGSCRECYNAPVDVLVADGLVWTGDIVRATDPGATEGRDPTTGEVRRTRPNDQEFFVPGMGHQRCYRNKATDRYLVFGRSGTEFIDLKTGTAIPHHWTRGTCQYGVMPCNGLLYVPPHSCACFIRSKLNGFHCLAPERLPALLEADDADRLERGPAYARPLDGRSPSADRNDWPTYRHDPARSGATPTPVAVDLKTLWATKLGGRLSSLVAAEGRLFVARVDAHTVHALDARDGQPLWSYPTGGRVDSPPTVWQGRVLFGSADGWVYCLRSSDGNLVWRIRVAPHDRRIVSYGQVESLWPVHGSVLVVDGIVSCAAGRSSYLDGGIRICRLDAETGRMLSETLIDDRDPETGYQRKDVVRGTNMPGALPDVLSCDGASIFMRHLRFDLEGRPLEPDVPHLFSAAGFLDDAWWHRTYWMIGTLMTTNYGGWPQAGSRVPAGRLLAVDGSSVYGFGRNQYIHHGAHVGIDGETIFHFKPDRDAEHRFTHYQAFALDRTDADAKPKPKAKAARGAAAPAKPYRWTRTLPILARALVLAGDKLVLAGPPDLFATDDPAGALEGTRGGAVVFLSPAEGDELAQVPLESPPVHDGLIAVGGKVYLATTDGRVMCLGE